MTVIRNLFVLAAAGIASAFSGDIGVDAMVSGSGISLGPAYMHQETDVTMELLKAADAMQRVVKSSSEGALERKAAALGLTQSDVDSLMPKMVVPLTASESSFEKIAKLAQVFGSDFQEHYKKMVVEMIK